MKQFRRPGFSLVELLVVIGILSILFALIAPAIQRVRAAAARSACANNLRQIAITGHLYHDAHRGLPPAVLRKGGSEQFNDFSWRIFVLPYCERDDLWKQAVADSIWVNAGKPGLPAGFTTIVPLYSCPADGRALQLHQVTTPNGKSTFDVAVTNYLGVAGSDCYQEDGVLYLDSATRLTDVRDGTSQTLLVGERPHDAMSGTGWWYYGFWQARGKTHSTLGVREINNMIDCPNPGPMVYMQGSLTDPCSALHFWSLHDGGSNFAFVDGSVRFISYAAAPLMPALASRAAHDVVSVE